METKVFVDNPMFGLQSSCSWSDKGDWIEVYAADLRRAEVGTIWSADFCDNGRGNDCESAEVVYKTAEGVAVLYRRWGTTDSDDPKPWENDPELWWIELKGKDGDPV